MIEDFRTTQNMLYLFNFQLVTIQKKRKINPLMEPLEAVIYC